MIQVTAPQSQDQAQWQQLFAAYAAFYGMPLTPEVADRVWQWIGDDSTPFYGLVAKDETGQLVGFAHVKALLSPLRGCAVGVLDDLFVTPQVRGEGVVEALFEGLKREGQKQGWPFIRWITKDNNYRARAVYDKVATRTDWVTYQLNLS